MAVEAVISEPVSGRTFPVTRENTGKFNRPWARDSQGASGFGGKFNCLPSEFPSRVNRENLRAIREPEADNSEPYPNSGTRCLAPHDLRPQVQISGAVCGGRGQLAESVFPFHSREGPPFGLTGLLETSNVTRPRLVEERTFRARVLTSPNDPNRTLPYGARLDASAVQAQADHSTTLRYRCQVA